MICAAHLSPAARQSGSEAQQRALTSRSSIGDTYIRAGLFWPSAAPSWSQYCSGRIGFANSERITRTKLLHGSLRCDRNRPLFDIVSWEEFRAAAPDGAHAPKTAWSSFCYCFTLLRVALGCTWLHFSKHAGNPIESRFVALLHLNRAFSPPVSWRRGIFPFLRVSEFEQHPNGHVASVCHTLMV